LYSHVSSLFSKFTLSSDGFHHLRIKDASLVGAEKTVDIQSTGKSDGSHSVCLLLALLMWRKGNPAEAVTILLA
jgi:hypothetical protein